MREEEDVEKKSNSNINEILEDGRLRREREMEMDDDDDEESSESNMSTTRSTDKK